MTDYAIAQIAGRQFRIERGAEMVVPRLRAAQGETLTLDKLLLVNAGGGVSVGAPYVEGASVTVEVINHSRGKKVRVFKKKRRKGYRKAVNARPRQTTIKVKEVAHSNV